MKTAQDTLIVQKLYDLIKEMGPVVGKFPRDQKFLLGDRIMKGLLDLLETFIEAVYVQKAAKAALLDRANIGLEKMRFLIRLSLDFECITLKRLESLSEKLYEIGKMTGGWKKQVVDN